MFEQSRSAYLWSSTESVRWLAVFRDKPNRKGLVAKLVMLTTMEDSRPMIHQGLHSRKKYLKIKCSFDTKLLLVLLTSSKLVDASFSTSIYVTIFLTYYLH